MFRKFPFLVRGARNAAASSEDILSEVLSREEVLSGFVTKCEKIRSYKYYPSYAEYLTGRSGYEHEVIFGWQHQKLKFDIDYTVDQAPEVKNCDILDLLLDAEPTFIESAMRKIMDTICDHLFYIYGI